MKIEKGLFERGFLTLLFLSITMMLCIAVENAEGADSTVNSSQSKGMSIHALKLKDAKGKQGTGDAILVESNGEFLLMDTARGTYDYQPNQKAEAKLSTAASLIAYLKKVGAGTSGHPLDIYISHVHRDHYGGLQNIVDNPAIKVRKVYLPHPAIGTAIRNGKGGSGSETDRKFVYRWTDNMAYSNDFDIAYLAPSFYPSYNSKFSQYGWYTGKPIISKFTIGGASVKILGPTKIYTKVKGYSDEELENNNSLCAMVECGNFKFLTMGDALEKSELDMVKKYGSKLKADIVKQNHHGQAGSNCTKFINKVKAKHAVACPPLHKKPSKITAEYTSVVIYRAYSKYGECISMGNKKIKTDLVFQKNPATGKIVRSCCNHDYSKKIFTVTNKGLIKNTVKVFCPVCVTSKSVIVYHPCTHKYKKGFGRFCTNQPYCYYRCPHPKSAWKSNKKGRICKKCKYQCKHLKLNKKLNCVKKKGKWVKAWSKKTGKCTVCHMKCKHKGKKKGVCNICKKKLK